MHSVTFFFLIYVVIVKHRLRYQYCRRRRDGVPRNSVAVAMETLRSRGAGQSILPYVLINHQTQYAYREQSRVGKFPSFPTHFSRTHP